MSESSNEDGIRPSRLKISPRTKVSISRPSRLVVSFVLPGKKTNSEASPSSRLKKSNNGKPPSRTSTLKSSFKKMVQVAALAPSASLAPKMKGASDRLVSSPESSMDIPFSHSLKPTAEAEEKPLEPLSARALSSNKGDAGEDNYFYLAPTDHSLAVLAAFDGLGGHSRGYGGEKGGRIASRTVATEGEKFFREVGGQLSEESITRFRDNIQQTLFGDAEENVRVSRLAGLATERLCTTACIASVSVPEEKGGSYTVDVAWMGDSRAYFISPTKGLQQLTVDDAGTSVPLDSHKAAVGGAPMTQYLSADMKEDWGFNFASHQFEEPGIVCSCTDGVFEYVPGPWEVEKYILQSLRASSNAEEWSAALTERFESVAKDDVTLLVEPVGFDSFDVLKATYLNRLDNLADFYSPVDQSPEMQEKLWQRYKDTYRQRIVSLENVAREEATVDVGTIECEHAIDAGHVDGGLDSQHDGGETEFHLGGDSGRE